MQFFIRTFLFYKFFQITNYNNITVSTMRLVLSAHVSFEYIIYSNIYRLLNINASALYKLYKQKNNIYI